MWMLLFRLLILLVANGLFAIERLKPGALPVPQDDELEGGKRAFRD